MQTSDYDENDFPDIEPFTADDLPPNSTAWKVLEELKSRNQARKDAGETLILPHEPKWQVRKEVCRERFDPKRNVHEIVPVTSGLTLRFNVPWRANSDSLAGELHLDCVSGEKGTYVDHRDRDTDNYEHDKENKFTKWSLYDMAYRLGIRPPKLVRQPSDQPKRPIAYTLAEYAEQHGVTVEYLTRTVKAREVMYFDPRAQEERLAIAFPTPNANRYRFLGETNGRYSKFAHDSGHGVCLYGFKRAVKFAQAHGFTSLGLVNGEPSVWSGQFYECPVFTISGEGEKNSIPQRLIEELRKGWSGNIVVFADNDETGHNAAIKRQQLLRRHGWNDTKIATAGNTFRGYDLGDMAYEYGEQTFERYRECVDTATSIPTLKPEDMGTVFSPFHIERNHLGMLMFNPKLIGMLPDWFVPEVYSTKQNQVLAESLLALHAKGRTIDPKSIMQWIDEHGGRTLFGNEHYIREWLESGTNWESFDSHTAAIHDAYKKRQIAALAIKLSHSAKDPDMDSEAVIGQLQESLNRINLVTEDNDVQSAGEIADTIENEKPTPAIDFNKAAHDKYLGGIAKGAYIIVAGPPGSGKTALVTDMVAHSAYLNDGFSYLYVSQEVPKSHITMRLAASICSSNIFHRDHPFLRQQELIVYSALVKGQATERQRDSWLIVSGMLNDLIPNVFVVFGQHTVSQIAARANRLYMKYGRPVIVVVDYVQYLDFEPNLKFSRNEHIEYNAKALKNLMKSDSVWAVIGLSEAATDVEKFQGAQAADLSQVTGSKSFAYLATTSLMIHPDRKQDEAEDEPKQRRAKPKGPQQNRVDEDDWLDMQDGRLHDYNPNKPLEKRKMWIQVMKNRDGQKDITYPMFYIPAANCWLSNREPEPGNYQSPHSKSYIPEGY